MEKSNKNNEMSQSERHGLIFKYVRLAIGQKNGQDGSIEKEMEEIRQKLNMTDEEIIDEAQQITTR
ncbi:hypothetical protein M1506_00990 [Patescibacteria group bacterium]|nr:hypothetical protein [Patescibacteria group bacterium]